MTTSATKQSKKQQFDPNKGYEELAQSLIELMENVLILSVDRGLEKLSIQTLLLGKNTKTAT